MPHTNTFLMQPTVTNSLVSPDGFQLTRRAQRPERTLREGARRISLCLSRSLSRAHACLRLPPRGFRRRRRERPGILYPASVSRVSVLGRSFRSLRSGPWWPPPRVGGATLGQGTLSAFRGLCLFFWRGGGEFCLFWTSGRQHPRAVGGPQCHQGPLCVQPVLISGPFFVHAAAFVCATTCASVLLSFDLRALMWAVRAST